MTNRDIQKALARTRPSSIEPSYDRPPAPMPNAPSDRTRLLWGKPTTTNPTNNTIILDPCNEAGADTGEDNITVYVTLPESGDNPSSSFDTSKPYGYLPFYDISEGEIRGVLIGFDSTIIEGDSFSRTFWVDVTKTGIVVVDDSIDWRGRSFVIPFVGFCVGTPSNGNGTGWIRVAASHTCVSFVGKDCTIEKLLFSYDGRPVASYITLYIRSGTSGSLCFRCETFNTRVQYAIMVTATSAQIDTPTHSL